MGGLFPVQEMNTAMTNIAEKVTETAGMVNYYPIMKKATSSSNHPTPGYIYEELIQFSFSSKESARHLVDYLNTRLQRPSPCGVLKTLKTVNHLVDRGAREVRRGFRLNEEYIKGAPQFGGQNNLLVGTSVLQEIQKIVDGLLVKLFDEDLRLRDESDDPEIAPSSVSELSGMGNIGNLGNSKYEGFGNSPINKSGIGDSIRDMVDSVLAVPDPKKQIMDLCLSNSTGDYQAVNMVDFSETVQSAPQTKCPKVKAHTPGRAGGGWDDDDDEKTQLDLLSSLVLSDTDDEGTGDITNSDEYRIVNNFCSKEEFPVDISDLKETFVSLESHNSTTCLFAVAKVCEIGSDVAKLRSLLLVEKYLQSGQVSPEMIGTVFKKMSDFVLLSENANLVVKCKKIALIIESLKSLKSG